jgi:transcriptional regulator with XRE-family HTH domain
MSIFSENIRVLRGQQNLSQTKLAEQLIITRVRLAKYEEGRSEPPFDVLQRIARHFHVSIDILLNVDLRKIPKDSLLKLEENRLLLPITIDKDGKDYIEILPYKAKAGYLTNYSDPEFIENLDLMSLPFLGNGKHRAFPIDGDSMPPHNEDSFIIGKFMDSISDIKDGRTYVVLTKDEGIVYKRLFKEKGKQNSFSLVSDNLAYKPYSLKTSEMLEIWEHVCSFCTSEFKLDDLSIVDLKRSVQELRLQISGMSEKLVN